MTLGNLHPHTGGQLRGTTELVANQFHDIQPITNVPGPQVLVCICPAGSVFEIDPTPPFSPAVAQARSCVPAPPVQ